METVLKTTICILYLLTLWTSALCSSCPSSCTCDWNEGNVNCSTLTTFPTFENASLIKKLDLSRNNLTSLRGNDLSEFSELESLDVSGNSITDITNGTFSMLPKILLINLSENKLTRVATGTFCNLTSLTSLRLSKNAITVLEPVTFHGLPRLTYIDLSGNGLMDIQRGSFHQLSSLSHIGLHYNNLKTVPSHIFAKTPNLKYLYLNGNQITRVEDFAFSHIEQPVRIILNDNQIWYMGVYAFQKNHTGNTLVEVNVAELHITGNNLTDVPAALNDLTNATYLDISNNHFNEIPVDAFSRLRILSLLRISNIMELRIIDSFAFKGLVNLRDLYITNCPNLRDVPGGTLQYTKSLRNLFLDNNGLLTIHSDLVDWQQLKILHLGYNNFKCDCTLKWLKYYSKWGTQYALSNIKGLKCSLPRSLEGKIVVDVEFDKLDCDKPAPQLSSKLMRGLVPAIIALTIIITCIAFVKYRKKWVFKYRQFKYSRHKHNGLYTINSKYSDLNENEEAPPGEMNKDDENLI